MQKFASIFLSDALAIYDVLEELAASCVLHDQIQLLARLYDLVQLDDCGMSHDFQDVYFTGHSLDVMYIDYLVFFQDFDGNFFPGEAMCADHDLSKGALSKVSAQDVVAHDLTFLQILGRRSRLTSIFATTSAFRISVFNLLHLHLFHHFQLGILLLQIDHRHPPRSPIATTSVCLCNLLISSSLSFQFLFIFSILEVSIFLSIQRIKYIGILRTIFSLSILANSSIIIS